MTFRSMHRNLKIRIVEIFVSAVLGNMLYPFLTIYFASKFGASLTGILMIGNVVCGALISFYGGHLGDKIGRRKTMLIAESIRFCTFLLMLVANSPWFEWPWVTYAALVVNGMCWGLAGPAAEAMVIDISTPENRKFIYSIQYWAINGAFVLGGLLGGFLFNAHRFAIYVGVTLGSLISVCLLLFFIQETLQPNARAALPKKQGQIREMITSYRTVFRDRTFMLYVLASLLIGSIEWQSRGYSGVRLAKEFGKQSLFQLGNWNFQVDGVSIFGIICSENSLLVVLLGLVITRVIKKYTDRSVLYCGVLAYGLGYAVIGMSNSPWLLLFAMIVATFGELMQVPVQQSMMADLPPDGNRSAYMAVQGLAFQGTNILGSLAVTIGAFLPSWAMGGIFFLTGVLSIVITEKNMPSMILRRQKVKHQAAA